ncbi:hypothetical protein COX73_00525 [bacterium (Candidatus Gribaldobacteria) CG_4_10_14_0_2_um_filter_36_18]|uniref:Uncharacterized protein n=1 Tax=bacterium (Candidatus Gribaldobacteria) CG_4_10_14_0_2_um_filter_36_18 TaxID=2014264 RepID=A0A2M7VKX7_9BACT|nr:MAG: hypothetical protein COX73_00525 [bacterium (Candidatus Gribaldobacteria) CG_4_10_14_0_2_um_filter_36_18]
MSVQCPYCKKELLKFPTRKTRCSYCDNFIYVRTRPSDRQRILVTEKGIKELKKEWEKYRAAAEFKRNLEGSDLGFTEEKYLKVKESLTQRFNFIPSEGDILWGMSNRLLEEAMKIGDWHSMKMIYFEQALFLHQSGKDCFKLLQEAAKCELRGYQQSDVVKKVEILTVGNQSCLVCQKLLGKILTIEEAFRDMPIPVKDCSHKINPEASTGWCRCCYIPVVE